MIGIRLGTSSLIGAIAAVMLACTDSPPAGTSAHTPPEDADTQHTEVDRVLSRMMASPQIHAEAGFKARVLVPPGEMYDPLFMRDRGNEVWVNDDGGQEGEKGGQILSIDADGGLSRVVPLGRLLPLTGFDFAPEGFGSYGGQVLSVAQPEVTSIGTPKNHVIQRIDPSTNEVGSVVCALPNAGTQNKGAAGGGIDARFGPEGSAFAGTFFAVTAMNGTVYQITSAGQCIPFVTFDFEEWGNPLALEFSPDGRYMLVSTLQDHRGSIARVRPDGVIESEPLIRSEHIRPSGMAYAPSSFGSFAGELFLASIGRGPGHVFRLEQQTHAPPADGEVYRLTPGGDLQLVASGLHNPFGIHFHEHRLLVSDVNADFIMGTRRELPDGFVVEISVAP